MMTITILHVPGLVKKKKKRYDDNLPWTGIFVMEYCKASGIKFIFLTPNSTTALHLSWNRLQKPFWLDKPMHYYFHWLLLNINSCYGGHSHRMQGVYIHHPFFIASAGSILKRHFHLIYDRKKNAVNTWFLFDDGTCQECQCCFCPPDVFWVSHLFLCYSASQCWVVATTIFSNMHTHTHTHKKSRLTNSRYMYIYI